MHSKSRIRSTLGCNQTLRASFLKPGIALVLILAGLASNELKAFADGGRQSIGSPYLGWSSWSLQATTAPGYGGSWFNQWNLAQQSNALKHTLQPYGYTYFNIDSGLLGGDWDQYGRPIPSKKDFPGGVQWISKVVHGNGQKLGVYWIPGVETNIYNANPQIYGTHYHIKDIVAQPLQTGNAFGKWHLKIDFTRPGAQEYIDSIVDEMAAWGVDFLKIDGVSPGSGNYVYSCDDRDDVHAYQTAIKQCGRPIWLTVSWKLTSEYAAFWQNNANARRVDKDVDIYGNTLVAWSTVQQRFNDVADWIPYTGRNGQTNGSPLGAGWNDFDSLDVANGSLDGLTDDEKKSAVAFWALQCSPLYTGDDLTRLDSKGLTLLTNSAIIALDQAGIAPSQIQGGDTPIWAAVNADNSCSVGLFNLGDTPATIELNFDSIHKSGSHLVWDYWTKTAIGRYNGSYSVTLASHASALVKVN